MTIFRAPLANSKGEVMLSMQATGVVPAGAVPFRGLWVTINGLVCATNDTGQARKYVGGFALEDPSGLLLVTETAPASVPMDGINASATGAVVTKGGAASLIHQGVGMTVSEPGGPIVVNKDEPALTFLAPLEYGIDSAAVEGVGTRDSQATYWAADGTLRIAGVNEIRQEFQNGQPLGTLMEQAATNKCENYNANPDAALTGIVIVAGVGTFERVNQVAALRRAGLDRVCHEGNVIRITETSGASAFAVRVDGFSGNLNPHIAQVYARVIQGEGRLNLTGGGAPFTEFTNTEFELIELLKTPLSNEAALQVQAQPNSIVEFILNHYEEADVKSSVIVTEGVAASRASDRVEWFNLDFINQTAGMGALLFRPAGTPTDQGNNNSRHLLVGETSTNPWISHGFTNTVGFISDGTTNVSSTLSYVANQLILLMWRWGSTTMDITNKSNGTIAPWASGAYDGAFLLNDRLRMGATLRFPIHYRSIYIWNEDKGRSWLESFFSGVAN